ncbi:MAG: PhoU domain-containing protein, partial [Pirellulales bacterium]
MTRHIERQIQSLKEKIQQVGTLVEEAISKSITAVINRDQPLAQRVLANDEQIDRMEVEVEEECLKI